MSIVVKNNIHWVGQRDWEVRDFHGTEYKTLRGSSYNSYLIREEKNVLIDTVDHKFSREFVQNLRNEIDLADIDYIVINHAEEDHAGALTELMAQIPDTPIYCTANAIDSINGHHHHPEWNFNVVKTGDTLDIGNGKQLIFVETPMLHWPDSMMTYLTGDAVLFSNDAFGQHYCDEHLFNDEVDQTELFEQCQRYYANILTPFSRLVTPKITEILGFNLPVDMIATSHGVVWRDNPTQIVELYLKWAADYQEDRITIFYDTMSNNTRMMADAIAQGIAETDPRVAVKIFNVARSDKNEILTNVFRSKGVLVGTSTMNNVMMPKIAGLVEEMTGLRFRNKRASAFGSHGWSGGAVLAAVDAVGEGGRVKGFVPGHFLPSVAYGHIIDGIAADKAMGGAPFVADAAAVVAYDVTVGKGVDTVGNVDFEAPGSCAGECHCWAVAQGDYVAADVQGLAPGRAVVDCQCQFHLVCSFCVFGRAMF